MIELRPVDNRFVLQTWHWWQDARWRSHEIPLMPHSPGQVFDIYDRMQRNGDCLWGVWDDQEPIGLIIFDQISTAHETAFLTNRFSENNSEVVVKAVILAMDWAFKNLRLHKIYSKVVSPLRLFDNYFEREGIMKEACRDPETGDRLDFTLFGITKDNFYASAPTKRVLRNRSREAPKEPVSEILGDGKL